MLDDNLDQSIKLFNNALILDSANTEALFGLGQAYLINEDIEKSMDCFQTGLSIDSTRTDMRSYLARSLFEMGDFNESILQSELSLESNPTLRMSRYYLGLSHQQLKDYSASNSNFKKAIEIPLSKKLSYGVIHLFTEKDDLFRVEKIQKKGEFETITNSYAGIAENYASLLDTKNALKYLVKGLYNHICYKVENTLDHMKII